MNDGPSRPPRPLAGFAALAMAAAVVLAGGRLVAGEPFAADRAILAAARGAGPAWLTRAAIDLTALGGGVVLTLLALAAAGLLLVRRRPLTAAALLAACWSGGRVVAAVKDLVARARPDLAERLVPVASASFPSAHAANSAVVYLTLAALAAPLAPDRATRRYLFGAATLLVAMIGASRVYLGVHWPSDVLAGWSFGALWALGWVTVARQSRAATRWR